MMETIELGKITAPVGIKGEIRVYPYLDEETRFYAVKKVMLDGAEYGVQKLRSQNGMLVIKLKGIEDRNAAEALKNKVLLVSRSSLELAEDSYFSQDLLGMEVVDEEGSLIGRLGEILQNPAHDLYRIEKEDGSSFLLPAVKAFIIGVDTEAKRMTVRLPEGLDSL